MEVRNEKPTRGIPRWVGYIVVAAALLAAGGVLLKWGSAQAWHGPPPDGPNVVLMDLPPIQQPPALSAGAAALHDDDEVIGVAAGGRHRAYLISALVPIDGHVVNDLLGGVPVTVSYCDRRDLVRVFTDPTGTRPLAVAVGGWTGQYTHGCMLLRLGSARYRHDDGRPLADGEAPFPYPDAEYQRTTWKRWRDAHPDTDVYVGEPTTPPEQGG